MKTNKYTLNIKTTNQNNTPLSDLKIRVRDKSNKRKRKPLDESTTDDSGQCVLSTEQSDIFIEVVKEDQIIFRLESFNFKEDRQEANLKLQIHEERPKIVKASRSKIKHPSLQGKQQFDLIVEVKNHQNKVIPQAVIEAWFDQEEGEDTFLGKGITQTNGKTLVRFFWDAYIKKSRKRAVYFKVRQEGKVIYNSKDENKIWSLLMNRVNVLLQVPKENATTTNNNTPTIENFNVIVQVKDEKGKPVPNHLIEARYHYIDKEDVLLGTSPSNNEGIGKISFDWDASVKSSGEKVLYLRVLQAGQVIHDSIQKGQLWKIFDNRIWIQVDVELGDDNEYPVQGIPILPNQFNLDLRDRSQLSDRQKGFIDGQLYAHLKDRIFSSLSINGEDVHDVVDGLDIKIGEYQDQSFGKLVYEVVVPALLKNPKTASLFEGRRIPTSSNENTTVEEILQLEKPIKEHPIFIQLIKKVKNHVLIDLATDDKDLTSQLLELNINWEKIIESDFENLIEEGTITEDQKEQLQHTLNLGKITGDNLSLIQHIIKNDSISEIKDFVKWEKKDWRDLLEKVENETPNNETLDEYIDNLVGVVETNYPTDFFITRLVVEKGEVEAEVNFTDKLLSNNPNLFSQKEINWEGIDTVEREQIEPSFKKLIKVVNQYNYLGIGEILNSDFSPKQKEEKVEETLQLIQTFYDDNPRMNLLATDFIKNPNGKETKLIWKRIPQESRTKVQRQMLAFQRVRSVASNFEASSKLLQNNLDSAYKIVYKGKSGIAGATQLPKEKVDALFAKAQVKATQAVQMYHTTIELHHNHIQNLTFDNTIPHAQVGFEVPVIDGKSIYPAPPQVTLYDEVRNELKDIQGFDDLFGPQNFCQCDHCKSVFSPAAYFVDLMQFVESNITTYSQDYETIVEGQPIIDKYPCNNPNENYPLWLKNRRPDLWDIELTCDCTYEMIPYLQIVNEIKGKYIKKLWVEEGRYSSTQIQDVDVYKDIYDDPTNHVFFNLPASRPFEELKILLKHFNVKLYDLLKANEDSSTKQDLGYLEALLRELSAGTSYSPFYFFGGLTQFTTIKVSEFLKFTKITRRELDVLLATNFIKPHSNIKIVKKEFDAGIQYHHEEMIDIDKKVLSYIHYFIQVWRRVPWTMQELDIVHQAIYHQIPAPQVGTPIFATPHLEAIVQLLKIQKILKINVEELVGIFDVLSNKSLKTVERKDELTGELFDENLPGFLSRRFDLEKLMDNYPTVSIDPANDDELLSYFFSGLKINRSEFDEMQGWLDPNMANIFSNPIEIHQYEVDMHLLDIPNLNPSYQYEVNGQMVNIQDRKNLRTQLFGASSNQTLEFTLSKYFQHITLARSLKLSFADWYKVLQLTGNELNTIEKIYEIVEWTQKWQSSPFSFDDLMVLTNTAPANAYGNSDDELKTLIYNEPFPVFGKDLFSVIPHPFLQAQVHVDQLFAQLESDNLIVKVDDDKDLYTLDLQYYSDKNGKVKQALNQVEAGLVNFEDEILECLNSQHYIKYISNQYISTDAFDKIGDLAKSEIILLWGRLIEMSFVEPTPGKQYYRVTEQFYQADLFDLLGKPPLDSLNLTVKNLQDFLLHPQTLVEERLKEIGGLGSTDVGILINELLNANHLQVISNSNGNKFYKVEFGTLNEYHISKLQTLIDNLPSSQSTTQDKLNQHIAAIDNLIITPRRRTVDDFTNLNLNQSDAVLLVNHLLEIGLIEATITPKFRVLDAYNVSDLQTNWVDTLLYNSLEEIDLKEKLKENLESIDVVLMEHHPQTQYFNLWKEVTGLEAEVVAALDDYLVINNWQNDFYTKLVTISSQNSLPTNFAGYIKEIKQLGLLIEKLEFDAIHLDFINGDLNGNKNINGVFGLNSVLTTDLLKLSAIEKLWTYHRWVKLDEQVVEDLLHPMLNEGRPTTGNKQYTVDAFSHYFGTPEQVTLDIFPTVFPTPGASMPIHRIDTMKDRALLCMELGLSGQQLRTFKNYQIYDEAQELVNVLTASFQAQYEEKEDFEYAYESFEEKINESRRDILCDYILGRREVNFKDTNEMYGYFLVDVEMGGCMKTSKVIVATQSLQTYVQRTLLGLEQNEMKLYNANGDVTGVVTNFKAMLDPSVKDQWVWRKNYRVWEANRKVFLYPENFIEPEWRDDKSPEFIELEEELLQEKITMDSSEEAYKKYLKKFTQIGGLKIANISFEQKDGEDIYHIFGRTYTDPYQYYYRKLTLHPLPDDPNIPKPVRKKEWTPWEIIDLAIPSPYVSSVIHQNKLFVFWVQIVILKEDHNVNGNTQTKWYNYQLRLFYSFKNFKGDWLQPQELSGFVLDHKDPTQFEVEHFEDSRIKHRIFPRSVLKNAGQSNEYYQLRIDYVREDTIHDSELVYIVDLSKNSLVERDNSDYWLLRENKIEYINSQGGKYLRKTNQSGAYPAPLIEKKIMEGSLSSYVDRLTGNLDFQITSKNAGIDNKIVLGKENDNILYFEREQYLIRETESNEHGISVNTNEDIVHLDSERISIPLSEEDVIEEFNDILFNKGFSKFLTINTQEEIRVASLIPFDYSNLLLQPFNDPDKLNFDGTNGLYYKELFFHIPFLIADHLNAEGKYEEADFWYRKIFDISAEPNRQLDNPIDKVWQYAEFRDQQFPKYSNVLTDQSALGVLNNDPFNPHAIARLRISAYQKSIVFKYVDNLLDWGDALFKRFTMESVFEALSIYLMAQDILGSRPQELCKCETGADDKLTYADIANSIDEGNDFLIWLENQQLVLEDVTNQQSSGSNQPATTGYNPKLNANGTKQSALNAGYTYTTADGRTIFVQNKTTKKPVFCVPMNKESLQYYDRVEDRLYKIRHCMNIDGVKQKLSLLAPAIDPRLLVAARASGLSIADALASLNAPVPNYRFSYMIEKAKSFAGTVQNFGGALLSALEKKDVEELTLLQSVHQRNILNLTTEIKKQQIEENKLQILNLGEVRRNIENRINYYSELISKGLIVWEEVQQKSQHLVSISKIAESVMGYIAATSSLAPQVGAPTAMTYGGIQLSGNAINTAMALQATADVASAVSISAGIEAGNQRRKQEWKQQFRLAEQELVAHDLQMSAAQIRLTIAEKDLEIHQNQIDQAKELFDFYKGKTTNLGWYNKLAKGLNWLHSQAFNLALDMAKQAELCHRFETDDSNYYIKNDNWDSGHAGLLAGERLTLQLQRLEKAYLENNPRREEITQSFSLRMLKPDQIVNLQNNGECTFTIPEWAFDIYYPGHYRRTIKTVRLTIPCVAGPYTNVSCRLTLTQNRMRTKPKLGNDFFFAGPNSANGSISTSTANNDGGQFELNFQDARYLPFEGGGAAGSEWTLQLPKAFKSFDYKSISDAIIHISYSALYDSTLKTQVETEIQNATNGLIGQDFFRLFSMKAEFPDELYQFQQTKKVDIKITPKHFPFLFSGNSIQFQGIQYYGLNGTNIEFNNFTVTPFSTNVPLPLDDTSGNGPKEFKGDVILLLKYQIS